MNSYTWSSSPPINNFAHVYSNSIITDTVNWTTIFGSFIADSSYQYLVLGNFFDDLNTDTTIYASGSGSFAYYYVDEVCVSTDSLFAENYYTDNIEKELLKDILIYPNPANSFITIDTKDFNERFDLSIYNPIGLELLRMENINGTQTINIEKFSESIMLINIRTKQKSYFYKFIKL